MNKSEFEKLLKTCSFPYLLIGRYATMFTDILDKRLIVYKYEDIKSNYNEVKKNPIIDITGLSSELIWSIIETFNNVILLNYNETIIDSKILSKMNLVIKDNNVAYSELIKSKEAEELIKVNRVRDFDKFYSESSPELYYLRNKTRKVNSSSKFIELLSKDEVNVSK